MTPVLLFFFVAIILFHTNEIFIKKINISVFTVSSFIVTLISDLWISWRLWPVVKPASVESFKL